LIWFNYLFNIFIIIYIKFIFYFLFLFHFYFFNYKFWIIVGRYRRSANNIRESLPVINFSNSSNNSRVTETPSTSAGNIIEKGKNEEKSENSVKYYKISCPICLDNSTVSTRLDSTICGKY